MADRRKRSTSTTTTDAQAPAEATTTTEEAPVTEQATTEAPASEAPASENKTPEKEVDLTPFKEAVAKAVSEADTSTGDVPEASLAEVTTAYRALEGIKAKNAAKAFVNEQMKDAMNSADLARARAHMQIGDKALVAAPGGKGGDKAPTDPTENYVQRVATLSLGHRLATATVPEGVAEDWQAKVEALVTESLDKANELMTWASADPESRGEEPEVGAVVRNAVKLAQGKAAKAGVSRGGGSFTGERRDIGAHILNAFEDKEVGTFLTIAEIRNTKSEEYGDTPPSAGAISARLFPQSGKSSMEKVGIKPDTQNGKKGAVKVEIEE